MSMQNLAALIVDDHPLFVDALIFALQPLLGLGQAAGWQRKRRLVHIDGFTLDRKIEI